MKFLNRFFRGDIIPLDKMLHFLMMFSINATLYAIYPNLWVLFIAPMVVGIGKEILDSRTPGNRFDFNDVIATVFGGIAYMIVVLVTNEIHQL